MDQSKQCPRCLRHKHEEVIDRDKKTHKRFLIDRCAEPSCHYGFDIEPWSDPNAPSAYETPEDPTELPRKPKRRWHL